MPPKKYLVRRTSSSGSGRSLGSREGSEMNLVTRSNAMTQAPIASSGSSPLGNYGVSPLLSASSLPPSGRLPPVMTSAVPKRTLARRSGGVISAEELMKQGLLQPTGHLAPLGGAMGARLERMGLVGQETTLASSSSAPAKMETPAKANPPDLSRRAGSLPPIGNPPSMAKGGKVKKTGIVLLHKGEVVIPKARVKAVAKAVKKAGLKAIRE